MAIDNKRKSGGGGGGNTPNMKRKSMGGGTPQFTKKAATPAQATPPSSKKMTKPLTPKESPPKPVVTKKTEEKVPAALGKIDAKSKNIQKKKNKNKTHKGQRQQAPKGQEGQHEKGNKGKRNRYQRMQAKLNAKPRSPLSCMRALKAEQELNKSSGRVFFVRLPDTPITMETIKGWSPAVENALFPKPVEPRSFLIVLKANVNVKKELETLKKVTFAGQKITIEERENSTLDGGKTLDTDSADLIDPYTIYVTNLDESVNRDDLRKLFPKATTFMNPRKHNPKTVKGGDNAKFAFIGFDTADEAMEGFKHCFNKEFKGGKAVVARFRRVGRKEIVAQQKTEATAKKPAPPAPAKAPKAEAKKEALSPAKKAVKVEQPEDSDEDDDEEEDEDVELSDAADDDDSEDDEDDGLDAEEDEDDDDDDEDDD